MSVKGVVFGIVGAAAGYIMGGPAGAVMGFGLGLGIGMAMDATTADAPDTPGQSQINKMEIPTCNYGDPLPDFIGTAKIAGNIIQSWGHRVVEVTEQQQSPAGKMGGGEGQTVVVGYEHYLSWLHSFAYGFEPASTLHTVLFDDKVVWHGTLTDDDVDGEETIQLGDPSGETLGSMTFYFGSSTQTANAKAVAALDDTTLGSAYRGLVYAMFDDVMVGTYARMPSIKIIVSKHPAIPAIGDSTLAVVNELDYNPAFAIYYLSDKHTGMSTSFLNAASFATAASYFKNTDFPGVGISMFISRQVTAETYIEAIMSHVGASLVEIDGELHLGVLRNDVSESSMDTITDTESLEIPSLTIGSWEDTFNDVKINYSKVNHRAELNCGSIVHEYTDIEEISDLSINERSILHISTDIYFICLGNATFKTYRIDTDGMIGPELDFHTYSTPSNLGSALGACIVSTNPAVTYVVVAGYRSTWRSTLATFSIDNATGVIAEVDYADMGIDLGPGGPDSIVSMGTQIYAVAVGGGVYTAEITINGLITTPAIDSIFIGGAYGKAYRVNAAGGGRNLLVGCTLSTGVFDRSAHIRSFTVDIVGSLTLLDTYNLPLLGNGSTLYHFDIVPEPYVTGDRSYSWHGIAYAYLDIGRSLVVETIGLVGGMFAGALTDSWIVKPVNVGDIYMSKIGGNYSTGKGIVLYYQYGTTLSSARLTTLLVEFDGTLTQPFEDDVQIIGGLIDSGIYNDEWMHGATPLLVEGSNGQYLMTFAKSPSHKPQLYTAQITGYCDEYT